MAHFVSDLVRCGDLDLRPLDLDLLTRVTHGIQMLGFYTLNWNLVEVPVLKL